MTKPTPFEKPAYEGDRVLFVPEMAGRAGRHAQSIHRWLSQGELPVVEIAGRRGCWESDFLAKLQPVTLE
ncbi:MAG: hypothetical protein AAGI11_04425 [Pseudomonadota bacterium]